MGYQSPEAPSDSNWFRLCQASLSLSRYESGWSCNRGAAVPRPSKSRQQVCDDSSCGKETSSTTTLPLWPNPGHLSKYLLTHAHLLALCAIFLTLGDPGDPLLCFDSALALESNRRAWLERSLHSSRLYSSASLILRMMPKHAQSRLGSKSCIWKRLTVA